MTVLGLVVGMGILAFRTVSPISAQSSEIRMAVMSDSSSDEYRADDNRAGGTQYATTTLAWTELLHRFRIYNFGIWGTRSEPRRSGYEYNWARTGAEAADVVSSGQHNGIASQIAAGQIDVVYFQIGNNDFAYYRDAADIYSGAISGASLDYKLNTYVTNVRTALDRVLSGNSVRVLLGTVADPGLSPYWQAQFPDSSRRQLVTNAIARVNTEIRAMANTRSRVRIFDQEVFARTLLGRADANGNLTVGGERISLVVNGDEPHHVIIGDNIHGGTVMEGLFANAVIQEMNALLGVSVPIFTDEEILFNAGINTTGTTPTPTPRPTATPTPRPTATPTPRPTATPTPRPTATPTPRPTATPTPRPTATPTPRPGITPTLTPRPQPTATPTPRPTATPTPRPTATPTPRPTATPTPRPGITPTLTPRPQPSATPIPQPTATRVPVPTPTPIAGELAATFQISSSSGDAYQDGSAGSVTSSTFFVGGNSQYFSGMRFDKVTVPRSATVKEAYIEVYVPSDTWITTSYQMYAHASGNSPVFSTGSMPGTRQGTVSRVFHTSNTSWAGGTWQRLQALTGPIQEVVSRSDWVSGNALAVIVQGDGSIYARKSVRAYDGGASYAPRLVVRYAGAPLATPTPVPLPTSIIWPTPTLMPTQPPGQQKTIRIVSRRNSASQSYVIFDGIIENGQNLTDVSSNRFVYSTGWIYLNSFGSGDSEFRYTTQDRSAITFTTNAGFLEIMTAQHQLTGSFDVYVNGVLKLSYNSNSATFGYVRVPVPL